MTQKQKEILQVPLLDIPASYEQILSDVEKKISEVIRSGRFILGPVVEELEARITDYCGTKYAIGVSSGTDALLISLMAAGIGEGDEVITTPFTFFATAGSIARVGAHPVFVDIEPETFNIDPKQIENKITDKTRALMPVHLYGQCANMDSILEVARRHGLAVIEDAAQAIGSEYKGQRAGSIGDYGCLSFFPTKNLGGFGDGGMVTTSSKELYERVKILRVHGSEPKYFHKTIGGNFRLDAIQAAVVLAKLNYLDHWTELRRQNAEIYKTLFEKRGLLNSLELPSETTPRHVYNQYVIRVKDYRDGLRQFLDKNHVATEIYYPLPLHLQECFDSLGYHQGDFPVAERAADEVLALPVYPELTESQLEYVVEMIAHFFEK
jgi:dTDP-4-amino-4,6-dideoxygalactose transaminase